MGFFFVSGKVENKNLKGISPDFLRKHGCAVCPLDKEKDLRHPKMEATGSKNPVVYMLGEGPGATEDQKGIQFVGVSGRIIRNRIPEEWKSKIRWNNAVNCRPPENRDPEPIELACCRPRLEQDIALTKPRSIFGFGAIPLNQVVKPDSKYAKISLWRGRRLPVIVGGHACWYYPMFHPSYILHKRKFSPRDLASYGSEEEFAFALDLERAFAEQDNLPEPIIHTVEEATKDIEIVYDINRIAELLDLTGNDPSTGVDLETNCLRPYTAGAKILSMACSSKSTTFAFPVDHPQANWTVLERKQLDVLIRRFLYESRSRKIVHHLPFELEWFGFFYGTGCFYANRWEDSESQAYLLDARRGSLSLDFLCLLHFGIKLKEISGLDRANLDKAPLEQVLKYNGSDSRYHRLLYLAQAKRIKQEGLVDQYEHQLRRLPSLVLAQMQGMPIDQEVVKKLKKKYEGKADKALTEIKQDESVKEFEVKKGRVFNPASSLDVNYLLKNVVGVDVASTDKAELSHVEHPIAKKLVAFREPMKVLSTYILPLDIKYKDNNVFPDGKIHPNFSTTTVVTWRTSSSEPNAQNYPMRDEERKEVRGPIKSSDPDIVVVSIDYAGIQARNVAMESKDKRLVEAYWHNYDIHTTWMERIIKKYPKWVPKSKLQDKEAMKGFRYRAKNQFVFPSFFGAQAFKLSEGLGIPQNLCEDLRTEFFDEFSGIDKWHTELKKFYYENGYVTGLSGFRRRAPVSINELINSPIQSDEVIIVMDAMARLSEMEDPRYQPAIMVHDDLTFFWPKKEVEKRLEIVVKEMISVPFEWANIVPIEVEAKWGPDWINMKEIGKFANNSWNGTVQIRE